jgi:hypothetical protein
MIRRLTERDHEYLIEAYSWDADYPQWYRDLEKVSHWPLEQFLKEAPDRADLGVFDDEKLVALISIIRRGVGVFEGHVWAKRGSKIQELAGATRWVIERLIEDLQMRFGYVWVAKRNLPIKQMCIMANLRFDGSTVIDGKSHGKPIEWQRFSVGG